ncbi:hypothetical protein C7447_101481 [Tenacibaculum adriaticum]|uniref:Tetratricopeptide repeat protein n=1 Tax=Tenacibaculum adriaticum TaxID=413713 RepID=A0A5S5DXV2_9FLAO|nr:hypothetical protein [Tenacibaculum adriaticum]TYP99876.1 hypothetical protein C7447_101481 [Tenacibaculum adriaticum]
MITQNLYKEQKTISLNSRIKASILFLVLILSSYAVFSQDSIVLQSSINEKKNLDFQEYFFNAITEKAIENYQKAIENLEECNLIIPNNKAVLFELSKNYLQLDKIPEALEYGYQALKTDPENLWVLEHLVTIHKKQKKYSKAIKIQEKIAKKYPKKKQEIVYLHLRNNDTNSAKNLLTELADAKMLNSRLRRIYKRLIKTKKTPVQQENVVLENTESSLKDQFLKNKSFVFLKNLLNQFDKENNPELQQYSNEGMRLFPAQPLVYLMNGKAHNRKNDFKKAIETLQNGIDFVIDDVEMEKRFYTELLKSYKGLGDDKNISKYQKKLKL